MKLILTPVEPARITLSAPAQGRMVRERCFPGEALSRTPAPGSVCLYLNGLLLEETDPREVEVDAGDQLTAVYWTA